MPRSLLAAALVLVVFVLATPSLAAQSEAETAVREAVHAFHQALEAGDSARALALLHPEATVYEGGHAETRAEYRSGHLPADIAFARAVRRTTVRDEVIALDSAALYTSEYTARGRFRDRDIDAHGTESIALVRTPDGWRIRHIHWSSR